MKFSEPFDHDTLSAMLSPNSSSLAYNYPEIKYLISVIIPDHNYKYVFRVKREALVWELRNQLIESFNLDKLAFSNYGLYIPADDVKNGKFLQDERSISEYPQLLQTPYEDGTGLSNDKLINEQNGTFAREPVFIEFLPKVRNVERYRMGSLKPHKHRTKRRQKELLTAVRRNDVQKVKQLLEYGIDPNFQSSADGVTPIGCAVELARPREMLLQLVDGGAYLDYRDAKTLTALHRAAISGNYESIKVLLQLGLNPNVKDLNNLTPLYHACSQDINPECVTCLLYDHAVLGVVDDKGRQEIHQACLFGRTKILEQLIIYGADLNAQADNLSTPMHMCIIADHSPCLRLLLQHGASREIVNAAGQTPYEFAILTSHQKLAEIIQNFDNNQIIKIDKQPEYNRDRKPSVHGPRAVYENLTRKQNGSLKSTNIEMMKYISLNRFHISGDFPSAPNNNGRKSMSVVNKQKNCGKPPTGRQPGYIIKIVHSSNDYSQYNQEADTNRNDRVSINKNIKEVFVKHEIESNNEFKLIHLNRENSNFGFVMQGSQTEPSKMPSYKQLYPEQCIEPGSEAEQADLTPGDSIIEVNGIDVPKSPHNDVIKLILKSNKKITMKVAPLVQPKVIYSKFHHIDLRRRSLSASTSASQYELLSSSDSNEPRSSSKTESVISTISYENNARRNIYDSFLNLSQTNSTTQSPISVMETKQTDSCTLFNHNISIGTTTPLENDSTNNTISPEGIKISNTNKIQMSYKRTTHEYPTNGAVQYVQFLPVSITKSSNLVSSDEHFVCTKTDSDLTEETNNGNRSSMELSEVEEHPYEIVISPSYSTVSASPNLPSQLFPEEINC